MITSVISALLNFMIIAGAPFAIYFLVQKRKKRGTRAIFQGVGLQFGHPRYLVYSVLSAAVLVGTFVVMSPDVEPFTRKGSAQESFAGLGLTGQSIFLALLYGIVKTGIPEELLFRGMIAGSLSRRLPFLWANVVQAAVFLLPHLVLLWIMPEWWPLLIGIFAGALFAGWLRFKSESILGPALIHAALNITTCLHVAIGSADA